MNQEQPRGEMMSQVRETNHAKRIALTFLIDSLLAGQGNICSVVPVVPER